MHVDTHAAIFSSDLKLGGIMLRDIEPEYQWPSFIAMDAPRHAPQRKTVSPLFTRPTSRSSRSSFANARRTCSTTSRATRRSIGWIASRSN